MKPTWANVEKIIAAKDAEIARLQELLRGTGANRYWEGRWRDADAENQKLRASLKEFADTQNASIPLWISMKARKAGEMREPRLPTSLEDDEATPPKEWTIKALKELAAQLGVMNDFYYPLIGAAGMFAKEGIMSLNLSENEINLLLSCVGITLNVVTDQEARTQLIALQTKLMAARK